MRANRGWIQLEDEVRKCLLVCSNCHKEIHYPRMTKGSSDWS